MLTVQKKYNQYVWIPVSNINEMVMCESNSGDSVCNLTLDGETLKCTVHPATATNLCGRLYLTTGYTHKRVNNQIIISYSMDFTKTNQTYTEYPKEPALSPDYDLDDGSTDVNGNTVNYMEKAGIVNKKASGLLEQMKSDYTKMATSVAKNGGFYISRYEIGSNGESKRKQTVLNELYTSGDMWYGLYKACRNEAKKIHMIFGSQYDQVIKFIGEEAKTGHNDRGLTTKEEPSGLNDKDKMKNIYDLEGNLFEWTAEAKLAGSTVNRALRPSGYGSAKARLFNTGCDRYQYPPTAQNQGWFGSRSALYI